ncbi:hypothetical protein C8Q72DRAFT_785068, partial [Fomitopsis betulina]
SKREQASKKRVKRVDTQILSSFEDAKYLSSEEDVDKRTGGARMTPILLKVSKPVREAKRWKKRVHCIASARCGQTWTWPRNRQCILSHAKDCSSVPAELRNQARDALAKLATKPAPGEEAKRSRGGEDGETSDDSDDNPSVKTDKVPAKKKKKQTGSEVDESRGTLDIFVASGRKEAVQTLKREADYRLLLYVVCNFIPPRTIDTPEFKAFAKRLNPAYDPPCSTTIQDKLIPAEAARLDVAVIEYLQGVRDLMLSFDGGKIRKPKGVYTITLSMPAHDPFTMVLKDGSRLTSFQLIEHLKVILQYMKSSTYTLEHFNDARVELKITQGLESIGKTQFSSYTWTGESVRRCIPVFRAIIQNAHLGIDIAVCLCYYSGYDSPSEALGFELDLLRFLAMTMPYAKSIKCLESAHAIPADVYLFWLAIMSKLKQLFTENHLQLPVSTMEDIRAISNQRFNELINNAPQDIYITAFFLDPRYWNAPIYKNINPLLIPSIWITGQPNARSAAPTESPHDAMVKRVGLCLLQLLKNEYGTLLNEKNVKEHMLKRNLLNFYHFRCYLIRLTWYGLVLCSATLRTVLYAYSLSLFILSIGLDYLSSYLSRLDTGHPGLRSLSI